MPHNDRVSVHFLFARAKRKWTKRESTPRELRPPLPGAGEGGAQFVPRSKNARISVCPQRFSGTARWKDSPLILPDVLRPPAGKSGAAAAAPARNDIRRLKASRFVQWRRDLKEGISPSFIVSIRGVKRGQKSKSSPRCCL